MAVDPALASWLGVLVGAFLVGTLWPYYNAWKASDGQTKFDPAYLLSALLATAAALPGVLVVYAIVLGVIPAGLAEYADSAWFLFMLGVALGAGADRYLNEKITDKGRSKPAAAPSPP